jgi:orotidine-5'-phosphate decarboxylase
MIFLEKLESRQKKSKTLLCVGLDPDLKRIPDIIRNGKSPILMFNKAIIDATHEFVCAFKPQAAYYGAVGAEHELAETVSYIHSVYPDIPVILDAKRGDIGPTATKYAEESFLRYNVDAVTVNPYLGYDSIQPFVEYKDKGVIILCKTSNKSSGDFQDLMISGKPLFEHVAEKALSEWNQNKNILFVVGATYPSQMKYLRQLAKNTVFLVPGIGAQGGSVSEICDNGLRPDGLGLILSSSRAIIHASQESDFAEKARIVAKLTRDEMLAHCSF